MNTLQSLSQDHHSHYHKKSPTAGCRNVPNLGEQFGWLTITEHKGLQEFYRKDGTLPPQRKRLMMVVCECRCGDQLSVYVQDLRRCTRYACDQCTKTTPKKVILPAPDPQELELHSISIPNVYNPKLLLMPVEMSINGSPRQQSALAWCEELKVSEREFMRKVASGTPPTVALRSLAY